MAKCERHDPPVQLPAFTYVLTLSQEEAQFLLDVTGLLIVGKGRRVLSDGIYHVLSNAGIKCNLLRDASGLIEFQDSALYV